MGRHVVRMRLAALAVACALPAAMVVAPGSAGASEPALACTAHVSNVDPHQNTKVIVYLHSRPKVSSHASARFKLRTEIRSAVTSSFGNAAFVFYVGQAKRGYTVHVTVTVIHDGVRGQCRTAFTPR
jgi:hypothetical protein